MKKFGRILLRVFLVLALVVAGYLVLAPTGRYLLRAGWRRARFSSTAGRSPPSSPTGHAARHPRQAAGRAGRPRVRAPTPLHLAAKQSFTTYSKARTRHARAGALRRLPRRAASGHVVVPGGRPGARTRGTSISRRRSRPKPTTRRRGLRRVPAAIAGVQHARVFQRPAAVDHARRGFAGTREHRDPRADAQQVLCEGRGSVQRELREFRGRARRGAVLPARAATALADCARATRIGHDELLLARCGSGRVPALDSAYKAHPASARRGMPRGIRCTRGPARTSWLDVGPQLRTIDPRYAARGCGWTMRRCLRG